MSFGKIIFFFSLLILNSSALFSQETEKTEALDSNKRNVIGFSFGGGYSFMNFSLMDNQSTPLWQLQKKYPRPLYVFGLEYEKEVKEKLFFNVGLLFHFTKLSADYLMGVNLLEENSNLSTMAIPFGITYYFKDVSKGSFFQANIQIQTDISKSGDINFRTFPLRRVFPVFEMDLGKSFKTYSSYIMTKCFVQIAPAMLLSSNNPYFSRFANAQFFAGGIKIDLR